MEHLAQPANPAARVLELAAEKFGVPPDLALAIGWQESRWNPYAKGKLDEIGLMQLRPGTARALGFDGPIKQLYNMELNAHLGVEYLRDQLRRYDGNVPKAVSAYNAGHATTSNRPYVASVLYTAELLRRARRRAKIKAWAIPILTGVVLGLLTEVGSSTRGTDETVESA